MTELADLYLRPIHRMLARVLGDEAEAREVARATLVRASGMLPELDGEIPLSLWLYRIAIDEAGPKLASARRRVAPVATDAPACFQQCLELSLAELPAGDRIAVVLRDVEGLTNDESASVLGLEVGDFKRLLHRGRMALVRRLEELDQFDPDRAERGEDDWSFASATG